MHVRMYIFRENYTACNYIIYNYVSIYYSDFFILDNSQTEVGGRGLMFYTALHHGLRCQFVKLQLMVGPLRQKKILRDLWNSPGAQNGNEKVLGFTGRKHPCKTEPLKNLYLSMKRNTYICIFLQIGKETAKKYPSRHDNLRGLLEKVWAGNERMNSRWKTALGRKTYKRGPGFFLRW